MNKQTTRELAIEWWGDVIEKDAAIYRMQYFNTRYILNDDQIEHIYLSENPQTETIKEDVPLDDFTGLTEGGVFEDMGITKVEDVQVGGFTQGEWKLDNTFYHIENTCVTDTNGNTIAECYRNAYHKDRKVAEANAKRIVTCVNNFSLMSDFIKRMASIKLPNGTVNGDYIALISEEAKAIINQIDNK